MEGSWGSIAAQASHAACPTAWLRERLVPRSAVSRGSAATKAIIPASPQPTSARPKFSSVEGSAAASAKRGGEPSSGGRGGATAPGAWLRVSAAKRSGPQRRSAAMAARAPTEAPA